MGVIKFKLKGEWKSRRVWLNGKELHPEPSQKIRNHSPDGFNWSYAGSGPAQLSLAICLELFGEEKARQIYQDFKFKYIATLPQTDFEREFEVEFNQLEIIIKSGKASEPNKERNPDVTSGP